MKTKAKHNVRIVIKASEDVEFDKTINDFLESQKKTTRQTYTTHMKRIVEFSGQTGKEILANPREWEQGIFNFQKWLQSKGYSEAYCQSACGCCEIFQSLSKTVSFHSWRKTKVG